MSMCVVCREGAHSGNLRHGSSLTLSMRSSNVLARGLYTHNAMRQYIGAGELAQ